jgi:hypothetical protein
METFIIGNGPSRKVVNLEVLKQKGIVWGCNALYRDFNPHYLLVIDKKMQQELVATGYHLDNKVIFRKSGKSSHIPKHPNVHTFNNRISSPNNSGMATIYHAFHRGFRHLYLIGFDFENPTKNNTQSNVYAGTNCYNRHGTRPPKLPKNIPDTLSRWMLNNHNKVQITRVINPETCTVPNLKGFQEPYMTHINYEEFIDRFHCGQRNE